MVQFPSNIVSAETNHRGEVQNLPLRGFRQIFGATVEILEYTACIEYKV